MNQKHEKKNVNKNPNEPQSNNAMPLIIADIRKNPKYFPPLQVLCNLSSIDCVKLELIKFENIKLSNDDIQATLFDKTIFALLNRQKFYSKDHKILFSFFAKRENFRKYCMTLGHKNFLKFFKKFFNACMDNRSETFPSQKIFSVYDAGELINFYICELYKLISKDKTNINYDFIENAESIKKLHDTKKGNIINIKDLDNIDKKYMKFLVKYILAFCNILENNKYYYNHPQIIYVILSEINDEFFNAYFMKQLYKIYLHKGIYENGTSFTGFVFTLIFSDKIKSHNYNFTETQFNLMETVLGFMPKYLKNDKNKEMIYSNGSSFYFLNALVLIRIMNDLKVEKDEQIIFLKKIMNKFSPKINLFLDDDTQLQVAELILTDNVNDNIIRGSLNEFELIKHYLENIEAINRTNYSRYFEYLFFDFSMRYYLFHLYNKNTEKNNSLFDSENSKQKLHNINLKREIYKSSQGMKKIDDFIKKEEPKKKVLTDKEISEIILNKYNFSTDYFINKYFLTKAKKKIAGEREKEKYEEKIEIILNNKTLEELFVILDILYFSYKFFEDKADEIIEDIKNVIIHIMKKSYDNSKFNCCIYNFLLCVNPKFIPSPEKFDIINSNQSLIRGKNIVQFIRTYPTFMVFFVNYCSNNNYDIDSFLKYISAFINGYCKEVFNKIDSGKDYNYILQLNYMKIIHFIIEEIFNVYLDKNEEIIFGTNIQIFLPYCINCEKKMKNSIICGDYLSQCFNCGEKYLYINTNIHKYLWNNKDKVKEFTEQYIFNFMTEITCNVLKKYDEKYNNKNQISLFCYNLYYKLMQEHFKFMRYIQYIYRKKIPIDENNNSIFRKTEGILEQDIKEFYEKKLTQNKKYPFRQIYETIDKDNFISFNCIRKTIKHESALIRNRFIIK